MKKKIENRKNVLVMIEKKIKGIFRDDVGFFFEGLQPFSTKVNFYDFVQSIFKNLHSGLYKWQLLLTRF